MGLNMNTEPNIENDTKSVAHAGILNWPAALMLVLWLLLILGFSGIETFKLLNSPIVLGINLIAAVCVTAWSIFRFFQTRHKNS